MKPRSLLPVLAILLLTPLLASAAPLADTLKGTLVRFDQGKVVRAAPDALAGKKFIAVYYSAHWCPPCRAFTPELMRFYDEAKAAHPDFDLIFVSNDRSAREMKEYMAWGKMNCLALDYAKRELPKLDALSARGIPYLIVLDADGKVLIGRPEGTDWIAPQKNLAKLKALLAQR